jgi:hypothetical protein
MSCRCDLALFDAAPAHKILASATGEAGCENVALLLKHLTQASVELLQLYYPYPATMSTLKYGQIVPTQEPFMQPLH